MASAEDQPPCQCPCPLPSRDQPAVASAAPPDRIPDGVGPTRAKHFAAVGVTTLGDLLEYFPRDYQSESAERDIADLKPEQIQTRPGRGGGRRLRRPAPAAPVRGDYFRRAAASSVARLVQRRVPPHQASTRASSSASRGWSSFPQLPADDQPEVGGRRAGRGADRRSSFRPVYPATAEPARATMIATRDRRQPGRGAGRRQRVVRPGAAGAARLLGRREAYRRRPPPAGRAAGAGRPPPARLRRVDAHATGPGPQQAAARRPALRPRPPRRQAARRTHSPAVSLRSHRRAAAGGLADPRRRP